MIPRHSADVGFHEVDFELTENNLRKHLVGKKWYTRTRFCILKSGDDFAVVQLEKRVDRNLFQTVTDLSIVSSPDRTLFKEYADVDVLNIGQMLRVQKKHPGKSVIVRGRFEHVSFIDVELPARIRVVDYVPPRPSKVVTLIESIIGKDEDIVKIDARLIDSVELAKEAGGRPTIFPCKASYGLRPDETEFLDQSPALSKQQLEGHSLIGCSLSARIFEELYGRKANLKNICVRESMHKFAGKEAVISRCCKVKEGVEVDDKLVLVPWGANICEVSEALRISLSM